MLFILDYKGNIRIVSFSTLLWKILNRFVFVYNGDAKSWLVSFGDSCRQDIHQYGVWLELKVKAPISRSFTSYSSQNAIAQRLLRSLEAILVPSKGCLQRSSFAILLRCFTTQVIFRCLPEASTLVLSMEVLCARGFFNVFHQLHFIRFK